MAFDSVQNRHRPGVLKQQNKAHKHGRHRSKGVIDNAAKGRTSAKTFTKKARHELRKGERKNKAAQIRQNKREEILLKKRSLGGATSAPLHIAVIPLCDNVDCTNAVALLQEADDEAVITHSPEGYVHISSPRFKQRFSVMMALPGSVTGTLDALKVADTALFLLSARHPDGIDAIGEKILSCSLAQGLPSTIVAVTELEYLPICKQHEGVQNLQKVVSSWLPDEKIMILSRFGDGLPILRRAGSQKQRDIKYRNARPYILAESVQYSPDVEGFTGTLKVTGYVRGQPLSANSLIHITGWGDFQLSQIDAPDDPHPLEKRTNGNRKEAYERSRNDKMDEGVRILEVAEPGKQESLESEYVPDPMDCEQTWPTVEELREADGGTRLIGRKREKVPEGLSNYQAAWIPDSDAEEVDMSEDVGDGMSTDMDELSEENSSDGEHDEEGESDAMTATGAAEAVQYDKNMDFAEEEEALKRMKVSEAQMDKLFPDERDTPKDMPARIHFQKYRGLKSFRTSPWDPKENLPSDYARIFQFENFDRTSKRIMKEENREGALPGWYVTIHVIGVPHDFFKSRQPYQAIVLFGLLPHEQKMSLLNFVIRRPNISRHDQKIIESNEELIFHCGYRRFRAKPIFSQHSNGTKHKYERFFQPDATVVASVFAPIMFPPAPVLVYKETGNGMQELVATGHLLSVNPDRIVVKRVVLSGYPFKILKRSAVVRFMFFNREDIEWFMPVELRTKYGRRGHIKEALGTHGHMKCVFDGQLKSQDTVLMNLYKREFPKWTYEPYVTSTSTMYGV